MSDRYLYLSRLGRIAQREADIVEISNGVLWVSLLLVASSAVDDTLVVYIVSCS